MTCKYDDPDGAMTRRLYRVDYEEAGPYTGNESEFTVLSADSAFECALQILRNYGYHGPATFRIIYGPEKDINVVRKVCMDCMTFNPYSGPDGVKRLELLEELAEGFADWVRASPSLFDSLHTRDIAKISKAISWDNGRVDRLKDE